MLKIHEECKALGEVIGSTLQCTKNQEHPSWGLVYRFWFRLNISLPCWGIGFSMCRFMDARTSLK